MTDWLPDALTAIFPGTMIPVEAFMSLHVRSVPEPLVTLDGVLVSVQLGTGTGATEAVTEAVHDPVLATFAVEIEYCVVAFDGGVIVRFPETPIGVFPGMRSPVRLLVSDQVTIAFVPFWTLDGLMFIEQVGGVVTGASARRAK